MHMKNDMNVCTILCLREEPIYSHWNREAGDYSDAYSILFLAGPKVFGKLRGDLDRKFSDLLTDSEDAITGYLYHCNAQNPS